MWIDANILLRLLTKQPEPMFQALVRTLQTMENQGHTVRVHPLHVTEALFVLEGKVYQVPADQAARELLEVLSLKVFEVCDEWFLASARRGTVSGDKIAP